MLVGNCPRVIVRSTIILVENCPSAIMLWGNDREVKNQELIILEAIIQGDHPVTQNIRSNFFFMKFLKCPH